MWIVRLALRRPYTFVVMALLILVVGMLSILRMPTDVFPEIDIPVIAVVWRYQGMSAEQIEKRITGSYERMITTTVNGIEHIESQALDGLSVTKVFFHQGTHIEEANAEITAASQTIIRQFPPGTTPPLIMVYNASNVPVLQASVSSKTLPEQQLFDVTANFFRTGLAVVQGAQLPWPSGGKQRQIMVDIDGPRLYAAGLSPREINDALAQQNLILPSGTAKLGEQELWVHVNSSPDAIADLNALPIKTTPSGSTITIGDVAHVHDGYAPQTSIVRVDGRRGALQAVLKSSGSSTLDIVTRVKNALPGILSTLPKDYDMKLLFDQSLFVRAAVEGVVKEGIIAAALTGLMILLFLGSWRSTLVVVVSIPLSILTSIGVMALLHQSLNLMTLGGLALAVGILVDDATVEIENVHRNLAQKKPLRRAILDGAQQIATPAFVATLCICIVFVPVVFITGAAKSLFTPLAMAVVFAMMTSYLLSRTLVPTMIDYLLKNETALYYGKPHPFRRSIVWRTHEAFNRAFERLRRAYGGWLAWALSHRKLAMGGFAAFAVLSCAALYPLTGRDFFPTVDAGQIKLHVRAAPGMRIEETEKLFTRVEDDIRASLPQGDVETLLDNIGMPNSGINIALGDGSLVSPADGEILIALSEHRQSKTYDDIALLRQKLAKDFPQATFFFLAPDITTQVLNFGLAAPIDVQIVGPQQNQEDNLKIARLLRDRIAAIPGAVDVHLAQVVGAPTLEVDVDRIEANQAGLSQKDVANDLLVSLSSSGQVAPSWWLDPKKGVSYLVAVQTPQYKIDSVAALQATPIDTPAANDAPQLLGNLSTVHRGEAQVNLTHYNVMPTFDVLASVHGTDLGTIAKGVDAIVREVKPTLPRGSSIVVRGQAESMQSSFQGLGYGLLFAVVLVYFLMVVNFQSWLDPLIILMALPGALAGILWMLFASGTTLSVPALMGAIMSIGVATSNSILLVTFANDRRAEGDDSTQAALAAGFTRLRPVTMTALAMIFGMLPMSLGLGEGGEQNAPLGRAVIGGLCLATVATLLFVPVVYSVLRKNERIAHDDALFAEGDAR